MEQTTLQEEKRDYAVLVGLRSPVLGDDSADEESLAELSALVDTAGGGRGHDPAEPGQAGPPQLHRRGQGGGGPPHGAGGEGHHGHLRQRPVPPPSCGC